MHSHDLIEALEPRALFAADPFNIAASRVVLSTPDAYRTTAVADIDNDGDLDVIVSAGPRLYTLRNDGQGRFAQSAVNKVSGLANSLALGDFNNDGFADLAALGPGTGTSSLLRIFFADGDGTWTRKSTVKSAGLQVHAANFDADAARELLVVGTQSVDVFQLETGTPKSPRNLFTSTGAITSTVLTDLNLDGAADIVLGQNTITGLNPRGGRVDALIVTPTAITQQAVFSSANARLDSVAVADLAGTTTPEIIFSGRQLSGVSANHYSIAVSTWNATGGSWGVPSEIYGEDASSPTFFKRDLRFTLGTIRDANADGRVDVCFRRELAFDALLNPDPPSYETFLGILTRKTTGNADQSAGYDLRSSDESLRGELRPTYILAQVDTGPVPDLLYMVLSDTPGGNNKLRLAQNVSSTI